MPRARTGTTWRQWGLAALAVLTIAPAAAPAQSASEIRFRIEVPSGAIEGEWRDIRVVRSLVYEQRPELSAVDVAIDLGDLATGDDRLDAYLRGPALFDVARHRQAIVRLRGARVEDGAHFVVDATMQLGGIVHRMPIRFTLTDPAQRRISGTFTLLAADLGPWLGAAGRAPDEPLLAVTIEAVLPEPVGTAAAEVKSRGARG